jgi:phosphate-selective porin OprO/OprP
MPASISRLACVALCLLPWGVLPAQDEAADVSQARVDEIEARLNNLQNEVRSIELNPNWQALQEGRLRSTDLPRVADTLESSPFPKVRVSGFFHADAGYFAQDDASRATFGDIQDVAGFRRARLAAVGDVYDNLSYMLEMDFATPGRPSFQDVWLDIHEVWGLGNVRIGQWRQPFGMEAMTSVRELMFLERSFVQAIVPFRQIGVGFHNSYADETITWAVSGFRFPTDQFGGVGTPSQSLPIPADSTLGDQGYGLATRATVLALGDSECGGLLHLGLGYCYLRPGTNTVQYRSPPEFGGPLVGQFGTSTYNLGNLASVPFFLDTGVVPTQNVNLYDAEIGVGLGSLYGQAEAMYAVIDTPEGTVALPGVYAQMGYFLTGEQRVYNRAGGVFGRVKPLASFALGEGWGAWEVALRYSYADFGNAFSDTLPPPNAGAPLFGGRENDVTVGLNWYLNQYAKFQFNYIQARLDREPIGLSETAIFAARAQLDF